MEYKYMMNQLYRYTQLFIYIIKSKYPESPINAWNFGFSCVYKTASIITINTSYKGNFKWVIFKWPIKFESLFCILTRSHYSNNNIIFIE